MQAVASAQFGRTAGKDCQRRSDRNGSGQAKAGSSNVGQGYCALPHTVRFLLPFSSACSVRMNFLCLVSLIALARRDTACTHYFKKKCMPVRMYACMHVCMYVCMYACMHVAVCNSMLQYVTVFMYVCMQQYVCMYVCIYVCMYVCM